MEEIFLYILYASVNEVCLVRQEYQGEIRKELTSKVPGVAWVDEVS